MPDAIVPSSAHPIASANGLVTPPWLRFFNAVVGQPAAIASVTVTASPFVYTASGPGTLVISGGTVSARTLTRNTTTVPVASSSIVMANRDAATISYSVAPTINFIPG